MRYRSLRKRIKWQVRTGEKLVVPDDVCVKEIE